MPPVRWKLSTVTSILLLQLVINTKAQFRQDEVSVDGWRPIIGTRKPNYYKSFSPANNDFYKYEVYSTPSPTMTAVSPTATARPSNPTFRSSVGPSKPPFHGSTMVPLKTTFRGSPQPTFLGGRKIHHQKPHPYYALPTHEVHGPHVPLGAVVHTRPGQFGHIKQHVTSKPFIQVSSSTIRNVKPVRMQTSTSGNRDEVFTASATSGAYSFYKQNPSNIRTRETVDLGLPGTNQYSINQPHAHIEFTNRFALPPPNTQSVYQQYNPQISAFVFDKHPQANDINYQFPHQQEDFTRNFGQAPNVHKNNEQVIRNKDVQFIGKQNIPENVVLQVPPPFQFIQLPQKVNEPQLQIQVNKYVPQTINEPQVQVQVNKYVPQTINEPQVQVQVTKENLHEFHNNVPQNYHGQYIEYDFSSMRKPTEAPRPLYEVTEGKAWEEPPSSKRPVRTRKPTTQSKKQRRPVYDVDTPVFLPTPYKPEVPSVEPTSPTQSEVSTIFTKLSKIQREKEVTTPNPFGYNIKEVSTHYPILGKPIFAVPHSSQELSNEITTHEDDETTTTTKEPQRIRPHRRRRPESRRTTSTTEAPVKTDTYDSQRTQEEETSESVEIERPVRQRRPHRYRTTTPPSSSEETSVKSSRGRNRYRHRHSELVNYEPIRKRQRPPWAEVTTTTTENHSSSEEYYRQSPQSTEAEEAASEKSEEVEEPPKDENIEQELPGRHYATEPPKKVIEETIKPFIIITTTEKAPTTNLIIPENDEEVTSVPNIEDTTTTVQPTTATTPVHRIRTRPFKFDNSNRPRFSVKEYRHKLSHYSTTAAPEIHRTTSETPVRIRIPGRLRRPSSTTVNNLEEESTETARPKFIPKDPRHSTTESTNAAIITEKNVKSVNTRLRPFGRFKTTTTTTTTPKVSIKPNFFVRKRPPMLSLRNKILSKQNKNNTESATDTVTTEENEARETTIEYQHGGENEPTTESSKKIKTTEENLEADTTTVGDFSKIDPYFYSQRVSDLTSSAKNEYNTPGLFKSVAPTSRRIPNYFTISTDDPILPIEAFFPNIKDKIRDKDS